MTLRIWKRAYTAVSRSKLQNTVDSLIAELNSDNAVAYQNLSKEMKNYMSYIVANVLMGDSQVLMKDAVDTSDATYVAWTSRRNHQSSGVSPVRNFQKLDRCDEDFRR